MREEIQLCSSFCMEISTAGPRIPSPPRLQWDGFIAGARINWLFELGKALQEVFWSYLAAGSPSAS